MATIWRAPIWRERKWSSESTSPWTTASRSPAAPGSGPRCPPGSTWWSTAHGSSSPLIWWESSISVMIQMLGLACSVCKALIFLLFLFLFLFFLSFYHATCKLRSFVHLLPFLIVNWRWLTILMKLQNNVIFSSSFFGFVLNFINVMWSNLIN